MSRNDLRRNLFHPKSLRSRPITEGSQGKTLEAGTEAQTVEKHRLLASFQGLLSLLIYPRTSCPGVTPPPPQVGAPNINHQYSTPQTCLQANHRDTVSQLRFPPPRYV